jgi:hypothetical protein
MGRILGVLGGVCYLLWCFENAGKAKNACPSASIQVNNASNLAESMELQNNFVVLALRNFTVSHIRMQRRSLAKEINNLCFLYPGVSRIRDAASSNLIT